EQFALQQAIGNRRAVDGDEGLPARLLCRCTRSAASSLPVPVSPVIRRLLEHAAMRDIWAFTDRIVWLTPRILSVEAGAPAAGIIPSMARTSCVGVNGRRR